jgi:FlgD Ig-like domain
MHSRSQLRWHSHSTSTLPTRPLRDVFVLSILLLHLASIPALAQLDTPVRITFNNVEDRTTTGSIARTCGGSLAVWMQEQTGAGWNLMWAMNEGLGWTPPLPLEAATHEDYEPRVMIPDAFYDEAHAVWQRGSGTGAQIMHGSRFGQLWLVEPVTFNNTEDVSPDIAGNFNGRLHVTWAGLDSKTGEGKIFYARKLVNPPVWGYEVLDQSELGPFWTGAAPKIAVSEFEDIVHIVYRGGDFGNYHAHYARRSPSGVWSYQVLTSLNAEDLVTDITPGHPFGPDEVVVAMSGNDCFGCPSRIYVRRSLDEGLTFSGPELVSGSHSAELGAIASGSVDNAVVSAELSGNIFTGNILLSRDLQTLTPHTIPPANHGCFSPGIAQDICFGRGQPDFFALGIAFTNFGSEKAPSDSAEVWAINGNVPGLAVEEPAAAPSAKLLVTAAPNPFSSSTVITATSLLPGSDVELNIYDSLGRLVRRFTEASPGAGNSQSWRWDGQDAAGRPAASGIFFVEMKQGSARAIDRLIRIR